jgi:perosamine synthetase
MIPYGRQSISEEDLRAVQEVLRSDWLTTGPKVPAFEAALAAFVGAKHGVAVSSGTAALHAAMHALELRPGDEVIVPAMTFAATANCVVYEGARPVFADVDPESLLIDPEDAARRITGHTRAILAVDFAGHPAPYGALRELAARHGLALVSDGCHALGAEAGGRKVGALADMTAFSFHPVKHITTGEGGMVTTDDDALAGRLRRFRNHGIATDFREREARGSWYYEMVDLGFNYRLTDLQCALGLSQLERLEDFLARRRQVAAAYDAAFAALAQVTPLRVLDGVKHAWHLYVVRIDFAALGTTRERAFAQLREAGIGVNVHYLPVHLHPYYRERFRTGPGLCPAAETAYEQILTLPMHFGLSDGDVQTVVEGLRGLGA